MVKILPLPSVPNLRLHLLELPVPLLLPRGQLLLVLLLLLQDVPEHGLLVENPPLRGDHGAPAGPERQGAAVEALDGVLAQAAVLGAEPGRGRVLAALVVGVHRGVGRVPAVAGHGGGGGGGGGEGGGGGGGEAVEDQLVTEKEKVCLLASSAVTLIMWLLFFWDAKRNFFVFSCHETCF